MYRLLLALFLLIPTFSPAQEAEDAEPPAAESAEPAEDEADELADAEDDLDDLGDLYPVEDEEKFIPSENVAFGQSIPFPTDI